MEYQFQPPQLRIRILLIIFLIFIVVFSGRIIYLTSIPVETYTFYNDTKNIVVKRGDIVDRNNKILAVNDELYSIYANPEKIKQKDLEPLCWQLSSILSINQKELREKLDSQRNFTWIKRQISVAEYEKFQAIKFNGVYATKEYKRIYPNRKLASHILGFCNVDNDGIEGIERSMNQYLKYSSENDFDDPPKISDGYNIQLTIDSNLQAMAERALETHARKVDAESGCLILLDGKTGEILAMASYPSYDPNFYSSYSQTTFRNNAIFYQYEPGSVLKLFTMAGMIANGGVTTDTEYFCDGAYSNGYQVVKCTGRHGTIILGGLFKTSCNVAPLQAAETIRKSDLYYYLKAFGFGESTDIELPGEQSGLIRKPTLWTASSMLAVPMGQEISSNALQVAQAATTLTNEGKLLRPHIIKSIYDNNGKILKSNPHKAVREVISKELAEDVITAMGEATTTGGSVWRLKVDGINFASKSGTAQMYDIQQQKYSNVEVSSSLLAIFPIESPRYIAYTVLHKPKANVNWGGVICSYLLNDFITSLRGYLPIFPAHYKINRNELLQQPITLGYQRISSLPAVMPDLSGVSMGDGCDLFSELNLKVQVYGAGQIYRQEPVVGSEITEKTTIKLYGKEE